MGTHPIFESDFDCLTEMVENSISATRDLIAKVASLNHQVDEINFSIRKFLMETRQAQSAQDFDAKSVISEQDEFFTPMISEAVSETSTLVGSRESLVEVGIGATKKERSFSVVEQE